MLGHGLDSSPFNPLQSDDYPPLTQAKYLTLNGRDGRNKFDIDGEESMEMDAIEKSLTEDNLTLWECVERLFQRVQQLEKRTQ